MKQIKFRITQTILPLLLGLFLSLGAYAQQVTVTGHVKDVAGEPVIGASVSVKGTSDGIITDIDGNFTLSAPQGSTLSITYIGYKPVEIPASSSVMVILEEDSQMLGDIVVIGYGTVKKEDLTGSVTAIKPDKLSKGITTSAQDMMTGKIAGVNVMSNGTPGGGATIRIRGGSSLNAKNDPLIVIDGLAMDDSGVKGLTNPLAMVNPNDIETFTVLKDASATAIYGSRASNGVIIITTKKGAAGSKARASYDGSVSFGVIQKTIDVMDANQFKNHVTSVWGGEAPAPFGDANTDWQNEIFQTAVSTDHNITITGGLKNMPYRISFGYTNQNGILSTSNFERYTASVNLAPSFFKDHLKFNINTKIMLVNQRDADTGAIGAALTMDPTRPVYDDADVYKNFDGFYQPTVSGSSYNDPNWPLTQEVNATANPVSLLKLKRHTAKNTSFVGNLAMDYKVHFLPDLHLHANLGGDYSDGRERNTNLPSAPGATYYGWAGIDYGYKYNLSINAYAQYAKELGNHFIDVMVGGEEQHFHYTGYGVGQGTNPLTGNANGTPNTRDLTAWGHHNTLVSYFARANYTLLNRYLLTATIRQDGSSRYLPDHRWGSFPSVALGWKIKEESFLQDVDALSDLKLRLGWGITGQQNLGDNLDFPYLPMFRQNGAGGYYPLGDIYYGTIRPIAYNPDLTWEKTTTYNAGIDIGFLNGRVSAAVDYYYRRTNDLLNIVQIPMMTNFNTELISNIGSLTNSGVELSINAKPVVTNDFVWDLGYNVTYNKNEITELTAGNNADYYVTAGDGLSTGIGAKAMVQKVGYPMNSFFVYQQVYDDNGAPIENMFVDRNADGVINASDKYLYKNPMADVLMGLTSKFTYKNWDLSFALRTSFNNYVYNDVFSSKANVGREGVYNHSFYSNRPVQGLALGFQGIGDFYLSDYFVENASFLRCDNINLGYSFQHLLRDASYSGLDGRIYATVQNPFVITKYTGLDPEANGIDKNIYPHPMTFMMGLSLQF